MPTMKLFLLCLFAKYELTAAARTGRRFVDEVVNHRELQDVDVCNIQGQEVQEASPVPIVPCDSHSRCDFTTSKIQEGFEPCCLNGCVCGNTQSEFAIGINKCARFACTSSLQCGAGVCLNGVCDFGNITPSCRADSECGPQQVCRNGRCYCTDQFGNIRPSSKGFRNNCAVSAKSGASPTPLNPTPPTPVPPTPPTPVNPTPAPVAPTTTAPPPLCTDENGQCGTFESIKFRPCCFPLTCRLGRCQADLQGDVDNFGRPRKNLLKESFYGGTELRAERGNRRRRVLKGSKKQT